MPAPVESVITIPVPGNVLEEGSFVRLKEAIRFSVMPGRLKRWMNTRLSWFAPTS